MLEPATNYLLVTALLALVGIAVLTDVQYRRIPNLLVMVGLVLGLVGHAWHSGTSGLVTAGAGACTGLLCLLPFYISGGMGAGDVKLMAMSGAFLGPAYVAVAAAASLVVGGILGVGWFFWQYGDTKNQGFDDVHAATKPVPTATGAAVPGIPYALAIAAGVLISLKAVPAISFALERGL